LHHFNKKRLHKKINEILLHHDNARPHVTNIIMNFLNACGTKTVPHPPYSLNLATCDFWLFSEIKYPLRGRKFNSNQEVIKAMEAWCKELKKNGLAFVFKK
jgi:histone-lysine N-methyltransferase SETMAR